MTCKTTITVYGIDGKPYPGAQVTVHLQADNKPEGETTSGSATADENGQVTLPLWPNPVVEWPVSQSEYWAWINHSHGSNHQRLGVVPDEEACEFKAHI